jgi:hypothetical protein
MCRDEWCEGDSGSSQASWDDHLRQVLRNDPSACDGDDDGDDESRGKGFDGDGGGSEWQMLPESPLPL